MLDEPGPVRFSVLGPLRAWRGETELELGAARQPRLILALLLVRAASGAGASITELVDLLWRGAPPASATNVVHRHVGQLRRLLEPGLATRATGSYLLRDGAEYRIRVDADGLDLARFRRLVTAAATTEAEAEDASAVRTYTKALGLWQDRCAAELRDGAQHPDFVAVDGEGFAAVRAAADAALRCGRVALIEQAVRRTAALEPLDEALQARLLLVLGAQGRPGEALAHYREVCRRLARERGIGPGDELRAAHDRLLRQNAATAVPETPDAKPPCQLPPMNPHFAGRDDMLDRAERVLADDRRAGRPTRALLIDGMPGVGKTTFAVHLAHRLAGCYPGGRLYADLRGFSPGGPVMSPAEALRGFLWSLGVEPAAIPADLHALAGLFRSILAGRRVLVLLDNCRDVEQIRHLLPGTGESLVIATSRRSLTAAGAHALTLEPLDPSEARAVLIRRLGPDRTAAEPAAVTRIVDRCGRLPLALALVATRSAVQPEMPLAAIAERLAPPGGRLDGFGDAGLDLSAVFSWSYRSLSEPAARLFRQLHRVVQFTAAEAAALAGLPPPTAAALLAELRSHSLLRSSGGRWHMHELLRGYASELSEETEQQLAA